MSRGKEKFVTIECIIESVASLSILEALADLYFDLIIAHNYPRYEALAKRK